MAGKGSGRDDGGDGIEGTGEVWIRRRGLDRDTDRVDADITWLTVFFKIQSSETMLRPHFFRFIFPVSL